MPKAIPDINRRYAEEYLVDLNQTEAYRRARGGKAKPNDRNTAYRIHQRPEVQALIAEMQAARSLRTQITQDAVLRELAKIGFGDPRKVMSWGPAGLKLKSSEEITDDEAAMVAEVSETTTKDGGSLRLKTCDKIKALELIGRHLAMFTDKHEISGELDVGFAERLQRAKERVGERE